MNSEKCNALCAILGNTCYSKKYFNNMSCEARYDDKTPGILKFNGTHGENRGCTDHYDEINLDKERELTGEFEITDDYIRISFNNIFCEEYKLFIRDNNAYILNTLYRLCAVNYQEFNILEGIRYAKVKSDLIDLKSINITSLFEILRLYNYIEWHNIECETNCEDLDSTFNEIYTNHLK